ncbi:E3 ubiquitin-protein ligase PRT6-like isoform X2 [Magnolia sinica]|uniref:E3 ubiquitin-protein ligase PRT6-like isoform X2 n=1 Tax=Magnolia sinica TaxID=86752 RepID=UPI00265A8743|nr:E3 ubiquitin-protein ligase PRT6-like isoform X2 [Magnolia sinica]
MDWLRFVPGMEPHSSPVRKLITPQDRILERLELCDVPKEMLDHLQLGLVAFAKENKSLLPQLVSAILPTDEDVNEVLQEGKVESGGSSKGPSMKEQFRESFVWLQWLMFEEEPRAFLKSLVKRGLGQRGVCGAVWGHKDIAYRCRTCEHDPTCAICVSCFQNGNHKDHDYSIMYTGGGCCDCGDVTAWKREGFCSKHKGVEQIQRLPEEIASSVGPIIDALLICWKERLLSAETAAKMKPRDGDCDMRGMAANELSSAAIEMLLDFSKHSESLLCFVSKRMLPSVGFLDVLVRAEWFLSKAVAKKLHELLLKLLGEPVFKYEFAKIFINYYAVIVNEAIKECSDSVFEKYPLLSTFSVQIFTVPTLTPRLVRELNLLNVMLGCLSDLFLSCVSEEGYLQVSRWASLFETTIRLVEDIRYIMSHVEVPKYVIQEMPDISITWMRLLTLVQGMDPQKRVTGLHLEEENENMHAPFILGNSIGNIHSLLVTGAFSLDEAEEIMQDLDDGDSLRHAKVGRLSEESSIGSMTGRSSSLSCVSQVTDINFGTSRPSVPRPVTWLIFECLKAIENWLGLDAAPKNPLDSSSPGTNSNTHYNTLTLKRSLLKIRKVRNVMRDYLTTSMAEGDMSRSRVTGSVEFHGRPGTSLPVYGGFHMNANSEGEGSAAAPQDNNPIDVDDLESENCSSLGVLYDSTIEADSAMEVDTLGVLSLKEWPDIIYDVSSQEISFHIPLHRLLSQLLQKALRSCYGDPELAEMTNAIPMGPLSACYNDFFDQVLWDFHPLGFSAFVMEHPLRLRVFCAEVRAGMWQKNGDAVILSCEWYRSARWWKEGLEFDLFLLQCCAALAPPDLFVKRILERFGLLDYLSLNLERSNKYEPVLVQEMLTLIIQIVKERRFCGLSTAENLRRELVYKLSVGDATHSQLVKALPHDLSKSDQLQETLDMLAEYSNPSGMKQGRYSLRKEYWKELDLYHPRWNSRDLQVAEERYLRFCKVSASTIQLPRWTKVFHPLNSISRIATSKVVLQLVRTVLFYAVFTDKSSPSRAPDGVLLTTLHLLSLALDICYIHKQTGVAKYGGDQSCSSTSAVDEDLFPLLTYASEEIDVAINGLDEWKHQSMLTLLISLMRKFKKENEHNLMEASPGNFSSLIENLLKKLAELDAECMTKLQLFAPDVVCHLSQISSAGSTKISVCTSDAEERKAKVRERQAAIMERMRAAQVKFIASLSSTESSELDSSKPEQDVSICDGNQVSEEPAPVVCSLCRDPDSKSPVSYLILLQKSRLASFVERGPPSWEEVPRSDKKHLSVGIRGMTDPSLNESTRHRQPTEVDALLDYIKAHLPAMRNIQVSNASYNSSTDLRSSPEMMEHDLYCAIQRGVNEMLQKSDALEDDQKCAVSHAEEGLMRKESSVLGEYVASLSGETPRHPPAPLAPEGDLLHGGNVLPKSAIQTAVFDGFGPTSCDGIHVSSCGHAVHLECRDRYLSSLKQRYMRRIVFEGGHIVDPDQGEFLCPVCRRFANSVLPAFQPCSTSLRGSSTTTDSYNNVISLPLALSLIRSASDVVGQTRFLKTMSLQMNDSMRRALEPVFRMLCRMYYPDKYDSMLASGRISHSLILWDTLRYSIISTEIAARGGKSKTSAGGYISGMEALYKEVDSSTGFVLSLLLQVAQTTRSQNRLQVLLRFRGIQLFAGSVCSGVSTDDIFTGSIPSILKHLDNGVNFPDIQFWKRAADPVLAHDPFSSLMWVLFCLPLPYLSSMEYFLSLVHLFYSVCVIQALITCHLNSHFDISELRFCDRLINDVCKIMGDSKVAQQHFVSYHIDSSCHPKDMIRRFTLPYLRRCALLWKLMKCSTVVPFSNSCHGWDRSSSYLNNDTLESTSGLLVELKEISELECLFQIVSPEAVLKDEVVHKLALKWCKHFCEFGVCDYGRILHSTPAVPFRLMRLPQIYQDLLQRYIKKQCPVCKSVPNEPALCLLCGRLCSPSWKSCCRDNGCQSHAMVCGAGIGVFLLIRKTTVLLQRSARQAPWPSPYLDAFGEEDIDMLRGKPLYLNEERYAALTHMVASHGLDRSSEVLRQTTIDTLFTV